MTVEELIERLREFPPHHHVFVEIGAEQDVVTLVESTANATVTIS